MGYLLFALVLVLGDFYARTMAGRRAGDRRPKKGDKPSVQFLRKYEVAFRVIGLCAIFACGVLAESMTNSASYYVLILGLFLLSVIALTASTTWPFLRWKR